MAGAEFAQPGVRTVTVPKRLGQEALRQFNLALDEALASPQLRVLVIKGDAEGFSSGMDLSEISDGLATDARGVRAATQSFVQALKTLLSANVLTLSVVEGPALGGGVGLAAACDLVLATEQASFALPEVLLGLVPAMILPVLAERLGLHQAKRWAMTQATWQAGEANQRGLVDQLVTVERLDAQMKRTLRSLLRLHPRGVSELKRFARSLDSRDLFSAIDQGQMLLGGLLEQPEVRAEIVAFRDFGVLPGVRGE